MSETEISHQIKKAIEKAYPEIRFTRHHCGLAKGWHGMVDLLNLVTLGGQITLLLPLSFTIEPVPFAFLIFLFS